MAIDTETVMLLAQAYLVAVNIYMMWQLDKINKSLKQSDTAEEE